MSENESIPSGSECAEAEEIHEDAPVIDVHAPHGGMHTWKDFWIHLGTIAVGLLIALGLEAGVEAMHRLHERHQLEDDLHAEAVKNQGLAENYYGLFDGNMVKTDASLRTVRVALAERGGKGRLSTGSQLVPVNLPPRHIYAFPVESVWETAKASGEIGLLPREEAESYTIVYSVNDEIHVNGAERTAIAVESKAVGCKFDDGSWSCVPDLSRMTEAQLEEYATLLTNYFAKLQSDRTRLDLFAASNSELIRGVRVSELPNLTALTEKMAAAHPPPVFQPTAAAPAKAPGK